MEPSALTKVELAFRDFNDIIDAFPDESTVTKKFREDVVESIKSAISKIESIDKPA